MRSLRDRIGWFALAAAMSGAMLWSSADVLGQTPSVGIDQHLGNVLPLSEFTFTDETGKKVVLKDLFDKPVALTLVYLRCPGICTPLLNEEVRVADLSDLVPGRDYRLISVSFDPSETSELAQRKKANLLATMKRHEVPADGWRFLVGDEDNIRRLTQAVGFNYVRDKNGVDFIHAAAVVFISPQGKISRYLTGTQFNPPDWKMAILDASEGNARSFMQSMQKLCYAYDSTKGSYVLAIDRVVLGVTIVVIVLFVLYLVRKKPKMPPIDPSGGSVS
jgi:protein SCO1/2